MSKKKRSDSGTGPDDSNLPEDTDANEPVVAEGLLPPPGAPGAPDALRLSPEQLTREKFSLEQLTREDKLALLAESGTLSRQDAEGLNDEELDAQTRAVLDRDEEELRRFAAAGAAPPAATPAATPSNAPAMGAPVPSGISLEPRLARVEAGARSRSREDKIALLSERTNLTVAEAAALTPEDLDFHTRAVLEQDEIAREAMARQSTADPNAVGDPYGDDKPQHYAVTEALRPVLIDGSYIQLRAGQIINDRSHNVEELKKYGAQLVPCETPAPYISQR